MLTLKIEIHGCDQVDIEMALQEACKLISQGYTRGFDSNDTGRYTFMTSGEEEPTREEEE